MTGWNEVRTTHGAALARVVASYSPPGADREDLAQEVALAVHQALPRFRGDASVRSYVLRIAHNVGLRHAVRRSRQPLAGQDAAEALADPEAVAGGPAAARHAEAERLHAAVRRLPLAQRQVVALALEELDHGEIATVLGISANSVATRLHRAKANLRTLLETP